MYFLFTPSHVIYEYFIKEKGYPRWKQLWQLLFHVSINPDSVFVLFYLFLAKEIPFLIRFAEARLAKIEDSLEEKAPGYRIAHLHLNVFQEDMDNRFHASCFDTNRLYLLETNNISRETQLGISNYRDIRKNKRKPRTMTEADKIMYKASSNETLFLMYRNYFMYYPVVILIGLLGLTIHTKFSIVSSSLILIDILSYYFMRSQHHDLVVDLSYALVGVVVSQTIYNTPQ